MNTLRIIHRGIGFITAMLIVANLNAFSSEIAKGIDFAEVAAKAKLAVVSLSVYGEGEKLISTGTGFFIDGGTMIATCLHVVKGARSVKWVSANREPVECTGVASFSVDSDLALLTTGSNAMSTLTISDENPAIGDHIAVFGSPRGFDGSLSDGIISALRNDKKDIQYVQITAPMSPGSSGSPVLNNKGEVVGIASYVVQDADALHFAVCSSYLTQLIQAWSKDPVVKPFSSLPEKKEAGFVFTTGESSYSVVFPSVPTITHKSEEGRQILVANLMTNGIALGASVTTIPSFEKDTLMQRFPATFEKIAKIQELVDVQTRVRETSLGIEAAYSGYQIHPEGRFLVSSTTYVLGQSTIEINTVEPPGRYASREGNEFEHSIKIVTKQHTESSTPQTSDTSLDPKFVLMGRLGYAALMLDTYFTLISGQDQDDIRLHEVDSESKRAIGYSFSGFTTDPVIRAQAGAPELSVLRKQARNVVLSNANRYGGYDTPEMKKWVDKIQSLFSIDIQKMKAFPPK